MTPVEELQAPVLILGVGNLLDSDDGVGVRVVQHLADRPLPSFVELADGGTSGNDWAYHIADRELVIVVDAVDAAALDVPAGTVVRMGIDDAAATGGGASSMHGFGMADALEMASILGRRPDELVVIGIAGMNFSPGMHLSSVVEDRLGAVADICLQTAHELLHHAEAANG